MAISLHGLGSLHYKQGEYERARQLYQQSLAINQELGDRAGVATTMAQMGLLLEQQGNLARAVTVMVQALQLFEQLAQPEAEQARSILARLQQAIGEDGFTDRPDAGRGGRRWTRPRTSGSARTADALNLWLPTSEE